MDAVSGSASPSPPPSRGESRSDTTRLGIRARTRRRPKAAYAAGRARDGSDRDGAGSPSRTRTCDKAINSRLLYQLSYRGSRGVSTQAHRPWQAEISPPLRPVGTVRGRAPGRPRQPPGLPLRHEKSRPRTCDPAGLILKRMFGGLARNRTGVQGFAVLCVTTPPRGLRRAPPCGGFAHPRRAAGSGWPVSSKATGATQRDTCRFCTEADAGGQPCQTRGTGSAR